MTADVRSMDAFDRARRGLAPTVLESRLDSLLQPKHAHSHGTVDQNAFPYRSKRASAVAFAPISRVTGKLA